MKKAIIKKAIQDYYGELFIGDNFYGIYNKLIGFRPELSDADKDIIETIKLNLKDTVYMASIANGKK